MRLPTPWLWLSLVELGVAVTLEQALAIHEAWADKYEKDCPKLIPPSKNTSNGMWGVGQTPFTSARNASLAN